MQDLTIALIQADLEWENADANLKRFDQRVDQVPEGTHLVVLPEMFATGFSMDPSPLAQSMDGSAVTWLKSTSQNKRFDITGSLIIRENDRFFNRLVWAKPDGSIYGYDKKHLFRYVGEDKHYTPGDSKLTVDCQGWKIRPFICYDLRFPIWTRNLNNAYDMAIFVANWPIQRSMPWKALLTARAIENMSYVAAVNRVGVDGDGNRYSGDSCIVTPVGQRLVEVSHDEAVIVETLSYKSLVSHRKNFPAWMDADVNLVVDD
jgi:predicted amidohydrolase